MTIQPSWFFPSKLKTNTGPSIKHFYNITIQSAQWFLWRDISYFSLSEHMAAMDMGVEFLISTRNSKFVKVQFNKCSCQRSQVCLHCGLGEENLHVTMTTYIAPHDPLVRWAKKKCTGILTLLNTYQVSLI